LADINFDVRVSRPFALPPFIQSGPLKYPIYKAARAEHADLFFKDGTLRVGTLWDFRRAEHGDRIGDPREGIRAYMVPGQRVTTLGGANVLDSWAFCMSEDRDDTRFSADGYDAIYEITSPEFFFAMARALSKIRELRFISLFTVAYADDDEVAAVTAEAIKRGKPPKLATPWMGLVKPPSHRPQREIRAVFEPMVDPNAGTYPGLSAGASVEAFMKMATQTSKLQPALIQVPAATRFARRVA